MNKLMAGNYIITISETGKINNIFRILSINNNNTVTVLCDTVTLVVETPNIEYCYSCNPDRYRILTRDEAKEFCVEHLI